MLFNEEPGKHWIVMVFKVARGEYFDSFARPPVGVFASYMKTYAPGGWTYNQGTRTAVCGAYCILYLLHRQDGQKMIDLIQRLFTKNTRANDLRVCTAMQRRFGLHLPLVDNFARS